MEKIVYMKIKKVRKRSVKVTKKISKKNLKAKVVVQKRSGKVRNIKKRVEGDVTLVKDDGDRTKAHKIGTAVNRNSK